MNLLFKNIAFGVFFSLTVMMLNGCSSDDPSVSNPFDQQQTEIGHTIITDSITTPSPTSIEGLHATIFKPTCANSGCHDGNFEPDFRTIESTYNTLVYRPVIKNDDQNPIRYRVKPGIPDSSMLLSRLLIDLNGNSGIMPLVLEPGNNWESTKAEHIANLKKWILDGALDRNGNAPEPSDSPLQLLGISGFMNGSELGRKSDLSPMLLPVNSNAVEIWVAFKDDKLNPMDLMNIKLDTSSKASGFNNQTPSFNLTYSSNPKQIKGFNGEVVDAYHKVNLPFKNYPLDHVLWLRAYGSDGLNDVEIPNDFSIFLLKQYATLKFQ